MSQAPGPEMSWAGSVSRPVVSKSLGPEMSRSQSLFAAGIVLELAHYLLTLLSSNHQVDSLTGAVMHAVLKPPKKSNL